MEENKIHQLIQDEIQQIKSFSKALFALSILAYTEKTNNSYSLEYETLNRLKKINIEISETIVFLGNSISKKEK